jgi:hypothetical protein
MSIKIVILQDVLGPVVICDWCGQRIVGDGNYTYRVVDGLPATGDVHFTHKQCDRLFREANEHDAGMWYWGSLEDFSKFLSNNVIR